MSDESTLCSAAATYVNQGMSMTCATDSLGAPTELCARPSGCSDGHGTTCKVNSKPSTRENPEKTCAGPTKPQRWPTPGTPPPPRGPLPEVWFKRRLYLNQSGCSAHRAGKDKGTKGTKGRGNLRAESAEASAQDRRGLKLCHLPV